MGSTFGLRKPKAMFGNFMESRFSKKDPFDNDNADESENQDPNSNNVMITTTNEGQGWRHRSSKKPYPSIIAQSA